MSRTPEPDDAKLHSVRRLVFLVGSNVIVTVAAIGWLYWIRGFVASWAGPRVVNALPIDAEASHASFPLVVFLIVFLGAGALLGVVARSLDLDRNVASVVLVFGVGVAYFLVNTISVIVVRQMSVGAALQDALSFDSIYFAAGMGGLGGALIGRRSPLDHHLGTEVAAGMTACCGILNLMSAIAPQVESTRSLVRAVVSGLLPPIDRAGAIPIGILLIVLSQGLRRRNRHAWIAAMCLLGVSLVLRTAQNLDDAATILTGVTALLLIAERQDFNVTIGQGVGSGGTGTSHQRPLVRRQVFTLRSRGIEK